MLFLKAITKLEAIDKQGLINEHFSKDFFKVKSY